MGSLFLPINHACRIRNHVCLAWLTLDILYQSEFGSIVIFGCSCTSSAVSTCKASLKRKSNKIALALPGVQSLQWLTTGESLGPPSGHEVSSIFTLALPPGVQYGWLLLSRTVTWFVSAAFSASSLSHYILSSIWTIGFLPFKFGSDKVLLGRQLLQIIIETLHSSTIYLNKAERSWSHSCSSYIAFLQRRACASIFILSTMVAPVAGFGNPSDDVALLRC